MTITNLGKQKPGTPAEPKISSETRYLLRSRRNAERLREAIEEAEAGNGVRMNPQELDRFIRGLDINGTAGKRHA